jgi:hypothetical protein
LSNQQHCNNLTSNLSGLFFPHAKRSNQILLNKNCKKKEPFLSFWGVTNGYYIPSKPPTFWFPSGREARKARAAAAAGNGSGPPAPAAPAPTASKVVMCGAVLQRLLVRGVSKWLLQPTKKQDIGREYIHI